MNAMLKMVVKCLKCCLWCFEKTVRYTHYGCTYHAWLHLPWLYLPWLYSLWLPVVLSEDCALRQTTAPHHATHTLTTPHTPHHAPPPHQVRFVTGYGFVYIAMEGSPFCSACFKTFQLVLGNLAQVAINT